MTELLLAIEEGKPPTNINELVAKCEGMGITDPSKFEEAGKLTPLQQAVHDKNVAAVFQLLEAERFNESEWNGMHYVRYEASDDNSDRLFILALLLKEDGRGGTQSISMMPNSTGTSAFVLACQANARSISCFYIDARWTPTQTDREIWIDLVSSDASEAMTLAIREGACGSSQLTNTRTESTCSPNSLRGGVASGIRRSLSL